MSLIQVELKLVMNHSCSQIKYQAEIAMDEADVIVFVTNARDGITQADQEVSKYVI